MKKLNRFLSALLVLLLFAAVFSSSAFAEGFQLSMPVEIQVQGSSAEKLNFRIQLKSLTPGAPMPEGSADSLFTMDFTGPGKKLLPEISFPGPGHFMYEITQLDTAAEHCSYDSAVYTMEVLLQNSPQGLMKTVVISKSGQDEKVGDIIFKNSYNPPAQPKPFPQTSDESDMALYAGLSLLSLLGAVYVLRKEKELKTKNR